jgi:chromosome segregation ATPase
MVRLPLDLLGGWIFGVTTSKVRPELREKLIRYREECYRELQRIAELGRAIARLAEQQIDLQRQQQHLSQRGDRAGQVVRTIQNDVTAMQVRLEMIEDTVSPGTPISKAQAAEMSQRVKGLAEQLTGMEKQKNFYQGIFGKLYRHRRTSQRVIGAAASHLKHRVGEAGQPNTSRQRQHANRRRRWTAASVSGPVALGRPAGAGREDQMQRRT